MASSSIPVPVQRQNFTRQQTSAQIRSARNRTPGIRTFYVPSESNPDTRYVVQFIRRSRQRRWFCDCADFKFRKLARKRHCKHIHHLAALAHDARGVSRLTL
jgi:hypothetical protein